MVLAETIVEGVSTVGSSVQRNVQVGFGPIDTREVVAQLRFQADATSGHTIVVAVDQRTAQRLIAALALALPRLG